MTLNIIKGGKKANSYNKPPEAPPESFQAVSEINCTDGTTVWVSAVRPDKLALVTYLNLAVESPEQKSPKFLATRFTELLEELKGAEDADASYWVNDTNKLGKFQLPFGERGSKVFIELQARNNSKTGEPDYRVKIEMNPRKLGPDGIESLMWTLKQALIPGLSLGLLLANARVQRVDAAVDLLGANIADLTVHTKKVGRRVDYHGDDGRLETIQLHRKKVKPKGPTKTLKNPLGPTAMIVYDKNRERAAHGKPAPFPGYELTRAEVALRHFKKPVSLQDILSFTPFAEVRIGLSGDYPPSIQASGAYAVWLDYLTFRRANGPKWAAAKLKLSPSRAKEFEKSIKDPEQPLVGPASALTWVDGINSTGLGLLVDMAVSPLP